MRIEKDNYIGVEIPTAEINFRTFLEQVYVLSMDGWDGYLNHFISYQIIGNNLYLVPFCSIYYNSGINHPSSFNYPVREELRKIYIENAKFHTIEKVKSLFLNTGYCPELKITKMDNKYSKKLYSLLPESIFILDKDEYIVKQSTHYIQMTNEVINRDKKVIRNFGGKSICKPWYARTGIICNSYRKYKYLPINDSKYLTGMEKGLNIYKFLEDEISSFKKECAKDSIQEGLWYNEDMMYIEYFGKNGITINFIGIKE